MLKFSYQKNHLSFVDDLKAHEEDYTKSGQIMEDAFNKLYKVGKMEELRDFIQNLKDIDVILSRYYIIYSRILTIMVSTRLRNANDIIG